MSYCRWSCDDFKSDVYVYEHVDGSWTTHVAGDKVIGEVPPVPALGSTSFEIAAYVAASKVRSAFLETAKHVPIGLAHDGKTFKDASPAECKATLIMLRGLGYHVPAHAIEGLDEEITEGVAQ